MSVIPKTEKVERVEENFNIFWPEGFTQEELKQLDSLNKNLRTVSPKYQFNFVKKYIALD